MSLCGLWVFHTDPIRPGVEKGLEVGAGEEKGLVSLEKASAHPEIVVGDLGLVVVCGVIG